MKICIFGAGAIGGYLGAKLAMAGADVGLVARGPHLAAIKDKGLTLIEKGAKPATVRVRASADPAELGVQDYVIVTLKAHSVPAVVGAMQPLIGDQTTIVSGVNGVPWWYFHKIGGPLEGTCNRLTRAMCNGMASAPIVCWVAWYTRQSKCPLRERSAISRAIDFHSASLTGQDPTARWLCRRCCNLQD